MKTATTLSIETKHPTAVAVGFFDGVHLGHRAVIESALAERKNGLECCVFSFAMNGSAPAAKRGARLLQSITLKKQTLEEMGADWLLIPHFSNFMGLTPEQCVDMAKKYVKESLGAAEGTENTAKLMEYIDKPGAIRLIFNTEKPIPVEAFDTLSDTDPSIKLDVNTGPKTALELMADLEKK